VQLKKEKKFVQYLAFPLLEAALLPEKVSSHFLFFNFFYSILGWIRIRNRTYYGSGSAKEKVAVPVPFHNTAVPSPS
jgi:hypothetical protein